MATSWLSQLWSHPIGARIAFYPSLLYGCIRTSPSRRWYDRIDNTVVLGALPFRWTAKKLCREERISRVVTLNEPYELFLCPDTSEWRQMGAEQLHLPTVDFNNAPSLNSINNAVDFILNNQGSVYVHCKAGRSRSTTVVVCYMIRRYGITIEQAVERVKEKRPHIVLGDVHRSRIAEFYKLHCEQDTKL